MKFYKFNEKENRIDIFNERWYPIEIDGNIEYFRNVTTILDIIDKGYGFQHYLKQSGFRADYLLAKAGEFGDIFHDITAKHDAGQLISYYDLKQSYNEEVSTELWKRIYRYCEYISSLSDTYKEKLKFHYIEKIVYSKTHKYAGTVDRIVEVDGCFEIWDLKTGSNVYDKYFLQLAAYRQAVKETLGLEITKGKILWFPEKKEEIDDDGKIKYSPNKNGYRIIEKDEQELDYYFGLFLATKLIFDHYNNDKPTFLSLPIKIEGLRSIDVNSEQNETENNKK